MSEEHHVWAPNQADPLHAEAVVALARQTPSRRTQVIAIDGPAGSGKSSLAALVAQRLDDAPIVHMDDLFPGWDGLAAAPALLTAQVLTPLGRGEAARFRQFDWAADAFADMVEVPGHDQVVIEGCGSTVGIARPYAAVRVWVDAGPATRKARGLARDGEAFAPHWERWARQEQAMYAADQTASHAHLRFTTG